MSAAERRKPGRPQKITGIRLLDLVAFMKEPGATTEKAADRFGVHASTIEKTLQRVRRESERGHDERGAA